MEIFYNDLIYMPSENAAQNIAVDIPCYLEIL